LTGPERERALREELARRCDWRCDYWGWAREPRRLIVAAGAAEQAARELLAGLPAPVDLELLADAATPARISSSWTALRREPAHDAEQVSQLIIGQEFNIWTRDAAGRWCLGAGADGYPGWVRSWHLAPGRGPRADHLLVQPTAPALASPEPGAPRLADLSFGTRLAADGRAVAGFLPWRLPDGRRAWTPLSRLERLAEEDAAVDPLARVLAWAPRLLGIPYDWGGASCRGYDCSGLVQALFGAAGRALPRDADQQARCGRRREFESQPACLAGDLIFYGQARIDHVALSLGESVILHASGEVKRETLAASFELNGRKAVAVVAGDSVPGIRKVHS